MEKKLGFDKVREQVRAYVSNALTSRMIDNMSFSSDHTRIARELAQVEEMRQILMSGAEFPQQDYHDLSEELERLKVGNTVIAVEAMMDFKSSLHTINSCLRFLTRDGSEQTPVLSSMAHNINLDSAILKQIDKIIDDKGEISDTASPELLDIRRHIARKRSEVDIQINKALSHAKREGWAPENGEVTIRNGRLVIPMIDTHRRKMKGLIHDESATRQTAYLEPADVVELNNDLRELEFAERHEINKILLRFSDFIRPQLTDLINAYWFLARIDLARAKVRYAIEVDACVPKIADTPTVNWTDARHPLLVVNHKEQNKEVVPLNISLNGSNRILIISGPNAGGKSVCLKTVGLLQYMLQCGLPVTCKETSEFGIFDDIFIDIGDQQSIENDLSTYSSHLQNMKQLLAKADDKTLFLLDELGSGTEPRSGCAIAEAVLEELYQRGSIGVVTTHYADLKLLADRHDGIVNGAMLFDNEQMRPLYKLSIGHPGSSFAFEIAKNIGFPESVLHNAEAKVGGTMLNFEHQLQQIEVDRLEIERQQKELKAADDFLSEVVEKYQTLNNRLEQKKYDILSEARKQARQIIADANKVVERTIADIKSANAQRERTRNARSAMQAELENIERQQQQHSEEIERQRRTRGDRSGKEHADRNDEGEVGVGLSVGDIVRIVDSETYGQLVQIKGSDAVVESNSIRMSIKTSRLVKTKKKAIPTDRTPRQNGKYQSIYDDINEKRLAFNPTLDLRGMRTDEALDKLVHHLDEARLLGEKELRILHGKGYGLLKTAVRQFLQKNAEVSSFESERLELGGEGITIVHLS